MLQIAISYPYINNNYSDKCTKKGRYVYLQVLLTLTTHILTNYT